MKKQKATSSSQEMKYRFYLGILFFLSFFFFLCVYVCVIGPSSWSMKDLQF